MFQLQVKDHFDAAHYIQDYKGKCSRMHGHRWEVEIVLCGKDLDQINMLVDFAIVKQFMKQATDRLDHYVLNDQLGNQNVTAEVLARWFWDFVYTRLLVEWDSKVELSQVTIWESPECCITYFGDDVNESK